MNLSEARRLCKENRTRQSGQVKVFLACSSTPLHLASFLEARLSLAFPHRRVSVVTGLYGDLVGNLERCWRDEGGPFDAVALVMEWQDVDPRLGWRGLGGWRRSDLADTLQAATTALGRLSAAVLQLASRCPVVVSGPHLPLPPVSFEPPCVMSRIELELEAEVAAFRKTVGSQPHVLVSVLRLDRRSDSSEDAHDLRTELQHGFPYTLRSASTIAAAIVEMVAPPQPKKGLITDLDDTLWSGILGDVGAEGVTWDLEHASQVHGLYQQTLASLADVGVLLGVASKNDVDLVESVLRRADLMLAADRLFPVEAEWAPKSASIERILRVWNVGPDTVVFVDDSPVELAEVQSAFPDMVCILFPKNDVLEFRRFLWTLRSLFGKLQIAKEDAVRVNSLRAREKLDAAKHGPDAGVFLASLDSRLTLDWSVRRDDSRAFDLVNKTNQFNLNGARFTQGEWDRLLSAPESVMLTVAYDDKYGPLGKIAVMVGRLFERHLEVQVWVLSCRAFARHIEHRMVRELFERFQMQEVHFAFNRTDRNHLVESFLVGCGAESRGGRFVLSANSASESAPSLPHTVTTVNPPSAHERN